MEVCKNGRYRKWLYFFHATCEIPATFQNFKNEKKKKKVS